MEHEQKNVHFLWKTLMRKWRESRNEYLKKERDLSAMTSFLTRLATRKKRRNLLRAKTLPTIDVTSILSQEEMPVSGINSSEASRNTTTCENSWNGNKVLFRKMSQPESTLGFLRQLGAGMAINFNELPSKYTKEQRVQRQRSSSEHRQRQSKRKIDTIQRSEMKENMNDQDKVKSVDQDSRNKSSMFDKMIQNMVKTSNEKRLDTSSTSGNLQKFSRLFAQNNRKQSRARSVSFDWVDTRNVKSFTFCLEDKSMDAVSDISMSPSVPAYLSKKISDQNNSPKTMRELRLNSLQKKKSLDMMDGQTNKRKSDKKNVCDIAGLFEAVEQQDLDLARFILSNSVVDINSLNEENLSVLDIAVMTNNIPMAKLLLSKGAMESPIFQNRGCRMQILETLVSEAEKKVVELTATVLNGNSGNANISPSQLKDNEKLLSHWEFKLKLFKRMKAGYDHAKVPEPPTNVKLHVYSDSSLQVSFDEPQSHNGAVVTKYKVEWSINSNFTTILGEALIENLSQLQYEIVNLSKVCPYFVRVCAWNVKGFSLYSLSDPICAIPSNWRDVDDIPSRLEGKVVSLQTLYQQVKNSKLSSHGEIKDISHRNLESPVQKRRISIKNLFLSTPKFQKSIKRGVYLACLFYNEEKILVTSEELLPLIEVDESFSGPSLQNDLYWLLKVSCMWEEVRTLKQDLEKTNTAGSTFRCKLLQAIISLQNGFGLTDLGQFFHRLITDSSDSIIFTVINNIKDPKIITSSSCKWVTFGKITRRQSLSSAIPSDPHSLLVNCVPDMIIYHQVSSLPLSKGLYLGYIKLQASVEVLRVMVPKKTPNCLPHVKIRDVHNVSKEEWEWLLNSDSTKKNLHMTSTQKNFQKKLIDATKKLFAQLDLPESTIVAHRIYDLEVLELSSSVTMIVILPSIEDICLVPGHSDSLVHKTSKEYCFLPVQIFESIHTCAYLPEFFSMYARLSAKVEMEGVLAQQEHREINFQLKGNMLLSAQMVMDLPRVPKMEHAKFQAFSSEELSKAKVQVQLTNNLQQNLDKIWKCARWIRDITAYARNKEKKSGIYLSHIFYSFDNGCALNELCNKTAKHNLPLSSSTSSDICLGVGIEHKCMSKFYDPNEENPHSSELLNIGLEQSSLKSKSFPSLPISSNQHKGKISQLTPSSSFSSTSTTASSSLAESSSESSAAQETSFAIIKVHALYDTGLNRNVNIKLHITEQTTSRDIVNLVVRHLNSVIQLKGKGVLAYSDQMLSNFCLVLKYQGHEKVLKDDYKILQLRSQLQKAKICVMMTGTMFSEEELGQATIV